MKLFLWVAKVAPVSSMYSFFKIMAHLFYKLDSKRRELTIQNLRNAYPEKSMEEIQTLSKDVYTELSKTVTEILLMFVDRFDIDTAVVNKEEVIKKLETLCQNSPKGIIAMTAHFSNWELLAHFLAKHGLPMLVIGREGNNKLIEEKITTPFRQKYGNDSAYKDNAMLTMVKRLKKGGNVGILIDQKSGHLNSVKVDFFGKKAETTTSIATLKEKLDPLVIPFFIARVENGKYKIIIKEPVEYSGNGDEDKLKKMTEQYNRVMENVIRKYPEQWFWLHNRWRL
ncbi:lysophospholipid acyltransferase family protein [Sulfurovum sp.]|uniref:lysophospholipid acyltransferase family protein n=1 Tax=Sulfurovum sp. TaxID=1969726 RepID=UPI0025F2F470|nr:lysophospholipid acyltransferase family protein [Sulfurovum sp.]